MWEPSYDYLEHHGIEGQKWGQRNGPPYPLDYKSHSAAEKKKNSKSSLSGYDKKEEKRKKKADKIIKDINKGGLDLQSRGYSQRLSNKGASSYAYIKKSANKDKELKRALNDTFKHPYSKQATDSYKKEAVRFVDGLLGERKNELVAYNKMPAREFVAYHFFDVKSDEVARIDKG